MNEIIYYNVPIAHSMLLHYHIIILLSIYFVVRFVSSRGQVILSHDNIKLTVQNDPEKEKHD